MECDAHHKDMVRLPAKYAQPLEDKTDRRTAGYTRFGETDFGPKSVPIIDWPLFKSLPMFGS